MKVEMNGDSVDNVDYLVQNKSQATLFADLTKLEWAIIVCAIGSFIATAMFAVNIAANGEMDASLWTVEQKIYVIGYLVVVSAVVAGELFLFASGYRGIAPLLITAALMLFGLYTEISLAMAREEKAVSVRSQESPTYKAALQAINKLSEQGNNISNPYATQIAAQAQMVARCERRVKDGREPHCDGDIARYEALKAQADSMMAASANASSTALVTALSTAKRWESDDSQHSGLIKFFVTTLGISHISATFLFMFIFVGTFRLAFWFIGDQLAAHKLALKRLGFEPSLKPTRKPKRKPLPEPSVSEPVIERSATQANKIKEPAKGISADKAETRNANRRTSEEVVPASEIVRLASIEILCMIADGKLTSFAFRPVNEALIKLGYGSSDQKRRTEIYPELVDHFFLEGYIKLNPDWIEFAEGEANPNGKRQKWLLNTDVCKEKAKGISRN